MADASSKIETWLIPCTAPYEVAKQASTIISMVPTGRHVRDVYIDGEKCVLAALQTLSKDQRSATLCMDQSTIEQSVSKAIALELRNAGADMVDAPVSGGKSTLPPTKSCYRHSLGLTYDLQVLLERRPVPSPSWLEVTRLPSTARSRFCRPWLARSLTVATLGLDLRRRSLISKIDDKNDSHLSFLFLEKT